MIGDWTIDYGDGPRAVSLPHSWGQDVPVEWEGPAMYRTRLRVPARPSWLVFRGVSYAARVRVDGREAVRHEGIWDPFSVPLADCQGKDIAIEVEVIKNGGPSYPVQDVLGGFLPYVFHTFGGIYRPVELIESEADPLIPRPAAAPRARIECGRLLIDGTPKLLRGLLHWGWYPAIGHPEPDEATIRREVRAARALGFNLVKFCLWIPPERYLEILAEEGMEGWIELPLWQPSGRRLEVIEAEIVRIVRRLTPYPAVLLWTLGCELNATTPYAWRARMVERIRELTGGAPVRDSSGGAEMYGGDPREVGDFDDFHPYCDLPFYPDVLDSLLPGPRAPRPILIGEFNDHDVHRDFPRLRAERPYWASSDPALNAPGVRTWMDLPRVIEREDDSNLVAISREKALFVRKCVQEEVRARDAIAGYVVTGWRDTPISTSGFFDDWDEPRFSPEHLAAWNGPNTLFLLRRRRPPWVRGGNRPGWEDPLNHFLGPTLIGIGAHGEEAGQNRLRWRVSAEDGREVARGEGELVALGPMQAREIGAVWWEPLTPGRYRLEAEWGDARNAWPLNVFAPPSEADFEGWTLYDPLDRFEGLTTSGGPNLLATRLPLDLDERLHTGTRVILFKSQAGLLPRPFWRESIHRVEKRAPQALRELGHNWARWTAVCPDAALDAAWLERTIGPGLMPWITRIDTRSYEEAPYAIGKDGLTVLSLRPEGGLGRQPSGVLANPAGYDLLRALVKSPCPNGA